MSCNCERPGEWFHHLKCPVARALRNCWCTPRWLCELIGEVHLDPCSNDRSHVVCKLFDCDDGLSIECPANWRVFINPPYGSGQVIKWVRAFRHTRFIYLLRWDPSTVWFSELLPACTHVWFPMRRIDFEPPPHTRSSSNPFPHALYLRDPSRELLERLKTSGYLFRVDEAFIAALHSTHGRAEGSNRGVRAGGGETDNAGNGGGGAEGAAGDREDGPTWTNPNEAATKEHWRQLAREAREWTEK